MTHFSWKPELTQIAFVFSFLDFGLFLDGFEGGIWFSTHIRSIFAQAAGFKFLLQRAPGSRHDAVGEGR